MHGEAALLEAWEDAQLHPAWRRPLSLLATLDGGPPADREPVGRAAARLLALARSWFGDRLEGSFRCRACGELLEVTLPVDTLLAAAPVPPDPAPMTVARDGWSVTARLPTPADLAAVASSGTTATAAGLLLERLVETADPPGALDDHAVVEEVAAAMEARDPLAVVTTAVSCPACGASDTAVVDIAAWCWALVDTWVQRLVFDIHRFARAYGWSEAEVLAVGPHRRARYLELLP